MPQIKIIFFEKEVIAKCDGRCDKAWGMNSRPRNKDDKFLTDDELGTAPADPGTYEGGDTKPSAGPLPDTKWAVRLMNKWCVRECERCDIRPALKLVSKDF